MAAEFAVTETPQAPQPLLPAGRVGRLVRYLTYPLRRGRRPDPRPATGFYTATTVCNGC